MKDINFKQTEDTLFLEEEHRDKDIQIYIKSFITLKLDIIK